MSIPNTNKVPNRLIHEKSPYLLQHAYNPVNWYPWGQEAFDTARREDKPVFLSIGYSTCHWCHVMAHESFEDAEVAEALNRDFIAVKVDKEERPDVDAVYMAVCQAMTGSGGWPLTILMTPEQAPFYAGTYFPKHSRYSMPGVLELLSAVSEQWRGNREQLLHTSEQIIKAIQERPGKGKTSRITKADFTGARDAFAQSFDEKFGGFGRSPKFPSPHNLMLLLRFSQLEDDDRALFMVEKTLRQMFQGGIYDHIGFGFSRYSTDNQWLVPHFEKMLYDNAMLAITYLEAYQLTGAEFYRTVAQSVLEYVKREMTDPSGGFYSAQDADSEGVEGKYYVFTPDEIRSVLGDASGACFNDYFQITGEGNFEGKNIPNRIGKTDFDMPDAKIQKMLPKVYEYRLKRAVLHKDDKILTSWNALMLVAYAKAYRFLGDNSYLQEAQRAVEFIRMNLTDDSGGLLVRSREGESSGSGGLDDYAFLIWAMLELYEATFEPEYLREALRLNRRMLDDFWDEENGGFYLTAKGAEQLIHRPKETYDGAIPSGNSVAGYCLARLAKLTGEPFLEDYAARQADFLASAVKEYPAGYSFALMAMIPFVYPGKEIVCVMKDEEDLEQLKKRLEKKLLFNTAVLVVTPENAEQVHGIAPFTKDYSLKNGKSTFYFCQNNACSAPVNDFAELEKNLL